MRLYAAGFNAWNQLRFHGLGENGAPRVSPSSSDVKAENENEIDAEPEPEDITSFSCILRDGLVSQVRSFLTFTAADLGVTTASHGLITAGATPTTALVTGYKYVEALNGRVVDGLLTRPELPGSVFTGLTDVVQIVAYDTGFAALTSTGQVWTWGDGRFPECLGRDVTNSPPDCPGRVNYLDDLPTGPVVHLAASGYVLAAVTSGHDLYCWGGYPGRTPVLADGLTGEPAPIVIVTDDDGTEEEADVVDVALGEAHMVALTTRGDVYVVGHNSNGQLGLGAGQPAAATSWTRVRLALAPGERITGIAAGPRSSFILTKGGD